MHLSIISIVLGLLGLSSGSFIEPPKYPIASQVANNNIVSVVQISTGKVLGTLNGYGNFSSPGPSYPFYTMVTSAGYIEFEGYGSCGFNPLGQFGCVDGQAFALFNASGTNLVQVGVGGGSSFFSVAATTDAAGGYDMYGRPIGIPVYAGNLSAIPVYLTIKGSSG